MNMMKQYNQLIVKTTLGLSLLLSSVCTFAAGDADVLEVSARQSADNSWTFEVTVKHKDTGWQDYANGWDVVLPSGEVVKPNSSNEFTRALWHPHVDEQPFTRSQNGIQIPDSVTSVTVRAHDLKDGFGGKEIIVSLQWLN